MLAAPVIDILPSAPGRRRQVAALVLSALLHLLLAVVWLGFPLPGHDHPAEPPAIAVDLVPPPMPPVAAPPQPQPESAPASLTRAVPQLQDGDLAEKSAAPPPKPAEAGEGIKPVSRPPASKTPEKPTQNERDWVLSRVMRHWKAPQGLLAYDRAEIRLAVTVLPDGHFAEIYDSRRPWNPAEVFDGYGSLPAGDIGRRTIDALYKAIRAAQPLALPDKLKAKAPFDVRLDVRLKDAR